MAVDLDDVIADTTDALRLYVNEITGLHLTKEDYKVPATYWGYYEHVWTAAGITDHSHIHTFHTQMGIDQSNIMPVTGAADTIGELRDVFDFVAVTSRELFMEKETKAWINEHFDDVFKEILLLGHIHTAKQTKGDACLELGASWLIDDNIGHCESAQQRGVNALLYGDYGWHDEFQGGMPHCKNWSDVGAYLSARS